MALYTFDKFIDLLSGEFTERTSNVQLKDSLINSLFDQDGVSFTPKFVVDHPSRAAQTLGIRTPRYKRDTYNQLLFTDASYLCLDGLTAYFINEDDAILFLLSN
jgi:ABC-type uncharacterized transport system involved in gliding motility auxiliary subunit